MQDPRLLRRLQDRQNAIRSLGIRLPARALARCPDNLAARVALLDRWLARELDLAGGRHLPSWEDSEPSSRWGPAPAPKPERGSR